MKKLGLGTHEAYAYVKDRSPWIGPNMSLIYQLTDYGRLCNHAPVNSKPHPTTPQSAPLQNSESRRYDDAAISPRTIPPAAGRLTRPTIARSQSERQDSLDVQVNLVAESLSSPRFVVSEETPGNGM
jgi:hypothetical protein